MSDAQVIATGTTLRVSSPVSAPAPEMRLVSAKGENFRNLEPFDIRIPSGIVGIVGENGTGKSSFLESVLIGLAGAEASRTDVADLLQRKGTGDLLLDLEFVLGSSLYEVKRTLTRKTLKPNAELFRDGALVASGTKPVNLALGELVGGLNSLRLSRFVQQKQLALLGSYDPAVRTVLILKLLGIGNADVAVKRLREKGRTFDAELKGLRRAMPDVAGLANRERDAVAAHQAALLRLAAASVEITNQTAALAAAEAALTVADAAKFAAADVAATIDLVSDALHSLAEEEGAHTDRLTTVGSDDGNLAELEAQIAAADAARPEYLALEEAATVRRHVAEFGAQIETLERTIATERQALTSLRSSAAGAERLAARETELDTELTTLASRCATLEGRRTELRGTGERLVADRDGARRVLALIESGETTDAHCPTCEQPLADPDALRRHIEQACAELATVVASGKEVRAALDAAKTSQAAASSEVAAVRAERRAADAAVTEARFVNATLVEHEATVVDLRRERDLALAAPYDEVRHAELAGLVERYPTLVTVAAEGRAKAATRTRLAEDGVALAKRRAGLEARLAEARTAATAAGYDPDAWAAAKAGVVSTRAALDAAIAERADADVARAIAERDEAACAAERAEHGRVADEIERLVDERGINALSVETMDRFKVHETGKIRPLLARRASVLLRELTDKRYTDLELDENYDIRIGLGAATYTIKSNSGGEEDLANLCLRLAISELINESIGTGRTFIVLDEVLGTQSTRRRNAIMSVLPKLNGHFCQVLMISHNDDVVDQFPSLIATRFNPATNRSRLEVVGPAVTPAIAA